MRLSPLTSTRQLCIQTRLHNHGCRGRQPRKSLTMACFIFGACYHWVQMRAISNFQHSVERSSGFDCRLPSINTAGRVGCRHYTLTLATMVTVIQLDKARAAECGYDGMPHTSDRLWAYVRETRIVGIRDAKKGWHGALPGAGQRVLCCPSI